MHRQSVGLVAASLLAIAGCQTPAPNAAVSEPSAAPEETSKPAVPSPAGWSRAEHARSIPHGQVISSLVLSPSATMATTLDAAMGLRVWPALDGSIEPVDPKLDRVTDTALARHEGQIILAALDSSGAVRIVRIKDDASVIEVHSSGPSAPATDVAVLPTTGITAILRSDRSIELRAPSGAKLGSYDRRSFQAVRLYVAGPNLLAALEASPSETEVTLKLNIFRVESAGSTARLTPVSEPQTIVVPESIPDLASSAFSPGAKRFAVVTKTPETATINVFAYDLEKGTKTVSVLGGNLAGFKTRIGFINANQVVATLTTGGGTWSIDTRHGAVTPLPVWTNGAAEPRVVGHGKVVSVYLSGLHVFDAESKRARFLVYRSFNPGLGAVSPSGRRFVYHSGADLYYYDAHEDALHTKKWDSESFSLRHSAFLDEDALLLISQYGSLKIIDLMTGETKARENGAGGAMRVDIDSRTGRVLVAPRRGEAWLYEVTSSEIKGPFVVSDNSSRSGFLEGEFALWTIDNGNVLRTYTMNELRAGVSRLAAMGRGWRVSGPYVTTVTRDGQLIASFHKGSQRVGRFDVGGPKQFGAESFSPKEGTQPVHEELVVATNGEFPSAPLASSNIVVSPDGKHLAVVTQHAVAVYAAGTMKSEWSMPIAQQVGGVRWGNGQVLVVHGGNGIAFYSKRGKLSHETCGPLFVVSEQEPPMALTGFAASFCGLRQ